MAKKTNVIELPTGRPDKIPETLGLTFSAIKLRAKTSVTTAIDFTIRSSIIYPLNKG